MSTIVPTQGCAPIVVSYSRDVAPSHYLLRIESFSNFAQMLAESKKKYYTSDIFEASGYKWSFYVYPNGDENRNGKGQISVFLSIEDIEALPQGWEIHTDLKFFMFDHLNDKYMIFQDCKVNRFYQLKTCIGIEKLVLRDVFDDAANGYLVNDKCAFGVEIFVLNSKFSGEFLNASMKIDETFTWKVSNYYNLGSEIRYSDEFTIGSLKWQLMFYPRGNPHYYPFEKNISLYLKLIDSEATCAKVFTHFMIRLRDQKSGKHIDGHGCQCFTPKSSWGWSNFCLLADIEDASKGFLVGNSITIEAHIKEMSTIDI